MAIDRERLATYFTELCEIESPSTHEANVSAYLQNHFKALGAASLDVDDSATATGSETGNLLITFTGDPSLGEPVFFNCHMDTVGPCRGVKVRREGDLFTSAGDTTLGSDDKSGIAALLELMTVLKEEKLTHCPIELLFTTCEEIGLLGAKAFDVSRLQAEYGYALDSTKRDKIIVGAPVANSVEVTVTGKAAHSGSAPETGINALAIAADALTRLNMGRLDDQSTANFGIIRGGTATNIVPEEVVLQGEVRSHSQELLEAHTGRIVDTFSRVVEHWPDADNETKPQVSFTIREEFPLMKLAESEPVLQRIRGAATRMNQQPLFDIAGGGSDANIFCGRGKPTAILPTGMDRVHTTDEQIELEDMVNLTQLLLGMVTVNSR